MKAARLKGLKKIEITDVTMLNMRSERFMITAF